MPAAGKGKAVGGNRGFLPFWPVGPRAIHSTNWSHLPLSIAPPKFEKWAIPNFPWLYGYGQAMAGQMNRVQPPPSLHPAHHPGLPGGGGQGNKQGLEDASDKDNGVLFGDEEVEQGQDEEAVDH